MANLFSHRRLNPVAAAYAALLLPSALLASAQAAAAPPTRSSAATTAPASASRGPAPKSVDARLLRKVTLQLKGVSLADFCTRLQEQTGVELTASRGVMDEKVTVFVKEEPARDLMRAVARLFGYYWVRTGEPGALRYELNQDLKSQLAEEELRNRDYHAALLALDAELEKYRPYLDVPYEQLQKMEEEQAETLTLEERRRESNLRLTRVTVGGFWGGMQCYLRLSATDRAALAAGQELVFRPDASDPARRFPDEVKNSLLKSWDVSPAAEEKSLANLPGARISQIRLLLNRSEMGQVSLRVVLTALWQGQYGDSRSGFDGEFVTSRSPAVRDLDNAKANAALRGQPPFDRIIKLRPEPSCLTVRKMMRGQIKRLPYGLGSASIGDIQLPHVFSSDVWEAVHRETGLPIVADYYTRMHRLDKVAVTDKSVFEALCTAGDAMGVRWAKDGDFLLCRSATYFWDKMKEIPNRYLQRWIADRDANGGLPLADLLEMASLPDQLLDSVIVSEGITHCLGLRDWGAMHSVAFRQSARFFSTLTPDQQRRAFLPDGIRFKELTPAQQQAAMQFWDALAVEGERQSGSPSAITPDQWAHSEICAEYCPAGWYMWNPPSTQPVPMAPVAGRTAAEALAAARRMWDGASTDQVQVREDGRFWAGIRITVDP